MSNQIKVTFEHDEKILRDPLYMGTFESDQEGDVFPIWITHNSNKSVRDCGFYISEYDKIYGGSASPRNDFDKTSWFADNYESYGLSVRQKHEIFGEIYQQESGRMLDITRTEETDFFSGFYVEILSGPIAGEKRMITKYDPVNNLFILESDFSTIVKNERYKIEMETLDYVRSKNGTSAQFPIPLLYNGGKIDRFEKVLIEIQLKIPPFMKAPGISFLNLNMQYTPEEEV